MPRQARKQSFSGYYHVIARGIGKQVLFENAGDYVYYISKLKDYSKEAKIQINAYCLMDNHVHILLRDRSGMLSDFMKKLGVCYAGYFNKKYDRSGHLFQDRFTSEGVEEESYMLAVFRYILNNPQKAGICLASEYPWSSYGKYDSPDSFVDTAFFRKKIGDWKHYTAFMDAENNDHCLEYNSRKDDEWAKWKLSDVLKIENGVALQKYSKDDRNDALRKLKQGGLSVRQIERLTGIGRGIIQRA